MPSVSVNSIKCINPASSNHIRSALVKGYPKINSYSSKPGRDYSYGYFLLPRSDAITLKDNQDITVVIEDGTTTVTIDQMIMVDTINLMGPTGDNTPVIIKLADYRFIANYMSRRHDVDPVPLHPKYTDRYNAKSSYTDIIKSYWQMSNMNSLSAAGDLDFSNADFPTVLLRDVHTLQFIIGMEPVE